MSPGKLVPAFLEDSWHGKLLVALYELYGELSLDIERWQRAAGYSCPPACGTCCAGYEPSVLPIEGMAVAAFAVEGPPSVPLVLETDPDIEPPRCVFYDPDNPLHCTVYPARPLECRLFAFSATRDKDGEPVFRFCRHMPGPEPRTFDVGALRSRFEALPPVMQDYSTRIRLLAEGVDRPLRAQARSAWRTVCYLRGLPPESGGTDGGPRAPWPIAS